MTIFLIGLMSSMVLMTLPTKEKTRLKAEAERFCSLLQLTQQEALSSGQIHGIRFYHNGYEMMLRKKGKWQGIKRITLSSDIFLTFRLHHKFEENIKEPDGIFHDTTSHDEALSEKPVPQIWLPGQGVIPRFQVEFHYFQGSSIWVVELKENGKMRSHKKGLTE